MSRNALQLIVASALLSISTLTAVAQAPATTAEKFTIRNGLGQTITLTAPSGGVTPYTLTFPALVAPINSLFYAANGTGQMGALPPGSDGQILSYSTSSGLTWTSAAIGSVTNVAAGNLSPLFTTNVTNPTTTPTINFNLNTQAAGMVFAGPVSGPNAAPTFRALTTGDITGGAALTKTDDANVTMTLGGSPTNALLNATSLTLGWTGLLAINRGGTNSNATPTDGGIAYGDGSAYQFTTVGTTGQVLSSNGTSAPAWANVNSLITGSALTDADDANVTLSLTGTPGTALLQPVTITAGWNGQLSIARGGTGASTANDALNNLLPSQATNAGKVLTTDGTNTSWTTPTNGTVTSFSSGNLAPLFTTNVSTPTTTPALSFSLTSQTANTVFAAPNGVNGVPSFRALTTGDITGAAALTKTDDANVTLTLGGSHATALLNPASITVGWTGLLGINRGGTNSSATPTNGGVAYGDGSAYQFTAAGSSGYVLKSNGAAAPSWVDPSSFITGAALTESDDANVQLTLTGTPGSALLQGVNIAAGWSGQLSIARGGTGAGTANDALNNLLPSQATNAGKVLTTDGTNTSWTTPTNGTVTSFSAGNLSPLFTTNVATATTTPALSFTLDNQSANTVFAAPNGVGGTPTFRQLVGADVAGAALTTTDDANVTLTLGGTPATALLNAASITAGWNGQLSIGRGGTGASTAPAALNNLLPSQAGNAGEYLTTDGAGNVSWAAATASGAWNTTGNTGTTAGTNFIGTTDNVDFVVKTNGSERVRVDATGQVGFGRSNPQATNDLDGGLIWRPDTLDFTVGATVSGGTNIRHDNVSIGDRAYYYIYDTATHYSNRVTGFTDGVNGKLLRIFNSTHTTLTLVVDDANSSAANRIRNPIGDNGNVGISDSGFADLIYDGESERWLIHSVSGPTSTAASGFTYFARKTADQTLTDVSHGTALQNATGMTINIFPDIVHTCDGMFYFSSPNSNVDVQIAFELTGGTADLSKITLLGHSDGGANVVDGSDIVQTNGTASATINVSGGTEMFVQVSGMFINGPSNATLQVKFKRVGGSSDLIMKQGSYLRLIPVGVD